MTFDFYFAPFLTKFAILIYQKCAAFYAHDFAAIHVLFFDDIKYLARFLVCIRQQVKWKVVFFPVESNAAQLEAMRSGRLHVAGFNTGSNPIAVSCAGFVPFAMQA